MDEPRWLAYEPPGAPHVHGRYTERTFDEAGLPEEQLVEAWCDHPDCEARGQVWKRRCASGHVRGHVATYALVHAHRDPLRAPRVEHPGSLRRPPDPDDPSGR